MINTIEPMDPNGIGKIVMDSDSDLEEATAYAKRQGFKLGSQLLDASTGDVYMLSSDGIWNKW